MKNAGAQGGAVGAVAAATCNAATGDAAIGTAATRDAAIGTAATGDAAMGTAVTRDAAMGTAATGDAAIGTAATGDAATQDAARDAATRDRVARSILDHGPSTAAELAGRLGLTPAAVRRHLDGLAERGLVQARERRSYGTRGRGRPAKAFALTDAGRAGFPSAYDALAVQALEALATTAGPAAVGALGRARLAEVETRFAGIAQADSVLTPAEALASALTAEGYAASTRPARAGEQLCQHHCPVAAVAERFPALCDAETEVFSRLLGVPVQRLATIAHGDGICTTHISSSTPQSVPPTAAPPTASLPRIRTRTTPSERQI